MNALVVTRFCETVSNQVIAFLAKIRLRRCLFPDSAETSLAFQVLNKKIDSKLRGY